MEILIRKCIIWLWIYRAIYPLASNAFSPPPSSIFVPLSFTTTTTHSSPTARKTICFPSNTKTHISIQGPTSYSCSGNILKSLVLYSQRKDRRATIEYDYEDDDEYGYSYNANNNHDDDYEIDNEYDNEYHNDETHNYWEWVTYRSTHILLPPPNNPNNPKTILHFIGGTIIGSYPTYFYKPFLQKIASQTNSILIASSIPIVVASNPLNHEDICVDMSKEFDKVYRHVLWEEYDRKDVDEMKIIGLGHSLGSRLQCLLTMNQERYTRNRRQRSGRSMDKMVAASQRRNGNIFIAFTNYNAMSSIPGLKDLREGLEDTNNWKDERKRKLDEEERRRKAYESARRRHRMSEELYDEHDDDNNNDDDDDDQWYDDQRKKKPRRRDESDRQVNADYNSRHSNKEYHNYDDYDEEYDDEYIDDYSQKRRKSPASNRRRRQARTRYDDYYYDDEYSDDLEKIFTSLSNNIQSQVSTLKAALTPDWEKSSLEFYPTPEALWQQIRRGDYSKNVKNTLVVQFDQDGMDQSSRLAQCILDSKVAVDSKSTAQKKNDKKDESPDDNDDNGSSNVDIKYARLGGTHLTPVTYPSNIRSIQRLLSVPVEAMMKEIQGDDGSSFQSMDSKQEKNLLIQSVVRYINLIADEP